MKTEGKTKEHTGNKLVKYFQHRSHPKTSSQPIVKLAKLNTECKKTEQLQVEIEGGYQTIAKNLQRETQEQERYKAIFESVNDVILIIDKQGTIVDVNQKFKDIGGYEKEEIIGKKLDSLARMITPRSLPVVLENFKKRMDGIDVPPYEVEMAKSSGESLILEINAKPLKQNGEIMGDLVILRDITEIKRAENTLKNSEKNLRNYLESAPDGIYLSDLKGTFLYENKKAETIVGYSKEELLGKSFMGLNLLRKKDLSRTAKLLKLNSTGQNTGPDEFQIKRRDGGHVWVEINTTPIRQNGQTIVIGFVRDITERKKVQQALSESESKFRILAEESPNMIFINKMGPIVYANKKCESIIGYKREELYSPGFDFFSLIAPEFRKQLKANFRDHLKGRNVKLLEYVLLTKNNERIEAVLATELITYENQTAILGVVTDVTQLKHAERLSTGILNNSPVGIYIVQDKKFKLVNHTFQKITGYTEEELLEKYSSGIVLPEDHSSVRESAIEMLKGKRSSPYEYRCVCKNGDIRWVAEQVTSILYQGRRATLGSFMDITNRKQAEAKLQETETMYHALFEQSPDGIVIIDIETAEILEFNDAACKQLGYSREEFAKVRIFDIEAMETPEEMRLHTSRILDQGMDNFITKHRTKQGEIRDVMVVGKPIDIFGKRLSLSIHRDITENKLIASELKQSYEKLQRTLETTVEAIAAITETRDPYTAGHQIRVTTLACAIADELGLSQKVIANIRIGGIIHDIGKIYVPAEILSKPGKLTEAEFMMIKNHPKVGYDIVKNIEFPCSVATIVLQHHERLDGSGYPQKLKGDDIILEARILAVADVVEAMSSHRPYRPALGIEKALDEVSTKKGILYDANVADACVRLFNEKRFKLE